MTRTHPIASRGREFADAQYLAKHMADAGKSDGGWHFSCGYSRRKYADSDIHVRQPGEGSAFVVHQAKASDNRPVCFTSSALSSH
jgi:hypothetical protein